MGIRKQTIIAADRASRTNVIRRDNGECVMCGIDGKHNRRTQIHEIISRSHWGTGKMHLCFDVKNRILLCPMHHELVQGNSNWMTFLLILLWLRHGYNYSEQEFARYLPDAVVRTTREEQ